MNEPPGIDALLLMVHGSPNATANAEMFRVVELIRNRCAYPMVEIGFLERNDPLIADAIDRCAAQGATRIIAVPYFLHTGAHVASDLPELLDAGRTRHPGIVFLMGDYIGRSTHVTTLLAARIDDARSPSR